MIVQLTQRQNFIRRFIKPPKPGHLKALSIRAPGWWFILRDEAWRQDFENRSWLPDYRGPLLIHASRWWNEKEVTRETLLHMNAARRLGYQGPGPQPDELMAACSHIVGQVVLDGAVTSSDSPWFWGPAGMHLTSPKRFLRPIRLRGTQWIYDVPAGSVEEAQ